jgi:hypothetical protein
VTVGAKNFQVFSVIIKSISVYVVNLQRNFSGHGVDFAQPALRTLVSAFVQQKLSDWALATTQFTVTASVYFSLQPLFNRE